MESSQKSFAVSIDLFYIFLPRKRRIEAQPLSPMASVPSCTRSGFSIAKMRRCSIICRSLSRPPCSKEKVTLSGPLGSWSLKPEITGFLGKSGLRFRFFLIALNISNRGKKGNYLTSRLINYSKAYQQ